MDTSKRSDKGPTTFNVVSWKGVLIPEVQEPITKADEVMIKFPANEMREISSVIFGNLRNV